MFHFEILQDPVRVHMALAKTSKPVKGRLVRQRGLPSRDVEPGGEL